jgi:hypothetical protein
LLYYVLLRKDIFLQYPTSRGLLVLSFHAAKK